MGNQTSKQSSLFLIELIIAILFFSFSAAVCVNMFAKAAIISEESYEINKSILKVQNAAESFKASNGDITKTAALLDGAVSEGFIKAAYDENWEKTNISNAAYILQICISNNSGNLKTAHITMSKHDELIYSLKICHLSRDRNE